MTVKPPVAELIKAYQEVAIGAVGELRSSLGENDLLLLFRSGRVPPEGRFGEDQSYSYAFHGVGCFVEWKGYRIDIEFGPEGRCDGFDLMRLGQFVDSNELSNLNIYRDHEKLKAEFDSLVAEGVIVCPHRAPSRHLFYWTDKT